MDKKKSVAANSSKIDGKFRANLTNLLLVETKTENIRSAAKVIGVSHETLYRVLRTKKVTDTIAWKFHQYGINAANVLKKAAALALPSEVERQKALDKLKPYRSCGHGGRHINKQKSILSNSIRPNSGKYYSHKGVKERAKRIRQMNRSIQMVKI